MESGFALAGADIAMRQLCGRILSIATGETKLPREKVIEYRDALSQIGFSIPELDIASVEPSPLPASTLGTKLLSAFESTLGRRIGCGTCRQLLLSWNQSESIDVADATEKIYRISLEIPETICGRNPVSQRQWIRGVVESVQRGIQ